MEQQQQNLKEPRGKRIEGVIFGAAFAIAAVYFLVTFSGFGYALWTSPETAGISSGWKLALIVTHLLPFAIIPVTMRVFFQREDYLISQGMHSPFAIQLGLAFLMVALSSEFGWHIQQEWFYHDDFTTLNFMFYAFLISAFALWADGFARNKYIDFLFTASLIAISIFYPLGAKFDNPQFKIPIFIALIIVFSFLTYRAYKVLRDWRIIFFPIFSVGVNLFFVFLLDRHESSPILNPLFHVLHDLVGTETGILIFTYLVYINPFRKLDLPFRQDKPARTDI
jgi:hypothetical protein